MEITPAAKNAKISPHRLKPLIWKSPEPMMKQPTSAMATPTRALGATFFLLKNRSKAKEKRGCKDTSTVELAMEV